MKKIVMCKGFEGFSLFLFLPIFFFFLFGSYGDFESKYSMSNIIYKDKDPLHLSSKPKVEKKTKTDIFHNTF